jgi:Fe-S cluster biosynthesis and repair protein YggX
LSATKNHRRRTFESIEVRVETIQCTRCGEENPRLDKPPFRTDLGERIQASICQACWKEWLQHQTLLINHYGLDPRDPTAREFLYQQVEQVLLKGGDGEEIDTSKEGTIEW